MTLPTETKNMTTQFTLGQLVITQQALTQLDPRDVQNSLARHAHGDWGNCDPEDAAANDAALIQGTRIFSVYYDRCGNKFWIITEADRASTCVLLPEDY
jgi:hypothetical protein